MRGQLPQNFLASVLDELTLPGKQSHAGIASTSPPVQLTYHLAPRFVVTLGLKTVRPSLPQKAPKLQLSYPLSLLVERVDFYLVNHQVATAKHTQIMQASWGKV